MTKAQKKELVEVFRSLHGTLCSYSRDMSQSAQDAWIYGIVVGWRESEDEIIKKHNWNEIPHGNGETCAAALKRLRKAFLKFGQDLSSERPTT